MRVLMSITVLAHCGITIQECPNSSWPAGTQVEVISIPPAAPKLPYLRHLQRKLREANVEGEHKYARSDAETAAERIRASSSALEVSEKVMEGAPADAILKEAADWGSDLILTGTHGYGAETLFSGGSIAGAVPSRAKCKVEIVRKPTLARCA